MRQQGLFISVEGTEGAGKSTNMAFLEDYLCGHDIELVTTREPGGTALGEELRNALLSVRGQVVDPTAELLMIFAARAQHLREVIEPALRAGQWVLCDRFTDATYAYQGGGRGLEPAAIARLEQLVQGDLRPDCTILLDIDVATGMQRASGRGRLDRIEQEELAFFERVRQSYLDLAQQHPHRYRVIDAGTPLPQMQQSLAALCDELLARDNGTQVERA